VSHANAFFDGILRARNFYRLALNTNFPFIWLIKASLLQNRVLYPVEHSTLFSIDILIL
jgi:hypothetical protein